MTRSLTIKELWPVLELGLMLRVFALLVGLWVDSNPDFLRYTDIDYDVFSRSGRLLYQGLSPYDQGTFRYPPLLALLMVPNEVIWSGFGKVVFCLADLAMVPAIHGLTDSGAGAVSRSWHFSDGRFCSFLWAVNPLSIVICSRGSCDSLTNCLLLWTLYSIKQASRKKSSLLGAGLALGLLVHFRLYPIIYVPAFLFHLTDRHTYNTIQLVTFFASAAMSFTYFTAFSAMCDERFLQEGLLYHVYRRDHRHNFSAYFYSTYLTASADSQACDTDNDSSWSWGGFALSLPLAPFVLQATLLLLIAVRLAREHLYLALLLSTMTFVAYNKVITTQYFTWYACLVPLVLPPFLQRERGLSSSWQLKAVAASFTAWIVTAAVWLWRAYVLEMRAVSTFLTIHYASLAFHVAHVVLVAALYKAYVDGVRWRPQPERGWR